jgi:hypothetical protein
MLKKYLIFVALLTRTRISNFSPFVHSFACAGHLPGDVCVDGEPGLERCLAITRPVEVEIPTVELEDTFEDSRVVRIGQKDLA